MTGVRGPLGVSEMFRFAGVGVLLFAPAFLLAELVTGIGSGSEQAQVELSSQSHCSDGGAI